MQALRTFKPIPLFASRKAISRKSGKSLNFCQRAKNMKNKIIMGYLTYSERLNYLLEMIQKGRLLSLKQASEKFDCSKRTIKRMLKALRNQGYQIKYCKKTGKYFIEN